MTRLVLRDPTTGSIRAVLETAEPYVAEGRSHMSHGTSGPPTQGPREIDGAIGGAHSPHRDESHLSSRSNDRPAVEFSDDS